MKKYHNPDKKAYSINILKIIITLSVPTVIEELLSTLLQYVDTAMVGQLGENASAAVSVTTTVSWLIGSIPSAISVAVLTMIAKAIGSGDSEKIRDISRHTALAVPVIGIFLGAVSMILSPFIPTWMGAEISIQKQASIYFFIISLSMLFRWDNFFHYVKKLSHGKNGWNLCARIIRRENVGDLQRE